MKIPWKAARFVLLAVILLLTPLVAAKKTRKESSFPVKTEEYDKVLTLWHIDTFEGGAGARSDFLNSRAIEFGEKGVLIMVISHTPESAETALSTGATPAMISFGTGLDFVAPRVKSLVKKSFFTSEIKGKTYAYPWCKGGYFLLRKNGDNRPINKLIVSDGKRNLALGAAYFLNENYDEIILKEPPEACADLISAGDGTALIGTQRDIKRLIMRGLNYTATPLEEYNDLYQYIAVTADEEAACAVARKFIDYLLTKKSQEKLSSYGMMPVTNGVSVCESLSAYDGAKTIAGVSAFTSQNSLENLKNALAESLKSRKKCQTFENALKRPPNA